MTETTRFRFMSDDDGHDYLIPVGYERAFEDWVAAAPYWENWVGDDFNEYRINCSTRFFTFETRRRTMVEELPIIDAEIVDPERDVEALAAIDFSPEQKTESEVLRQHIAIQVQRVRQGYEDFSRGFVRLGQLMYRVRSTRCWSLWGYHSFNAYVKDVGLTVDKKRTQIYGTVGIAERLLPNVPEKELENMGITNAMALARVVKISGKAPSPEVVRQGATMHRDEYQAVLEQEFRVFDDKDKGKWRNIGGFFSTEEEWKTIQLAFEIAAKMEQFGKEVPENQRTKQILISLSEEFIGTHGGELEQT